LAPENVIASQEIEDIEVTPLMRDLLERNGLGLLTDVEFYLEALAMASRLQP
jgi:hypothetical protein